MINRLWFGTMTVLLTTVVGCGATAIPHVTATGTQKSCPVGTTSVRESGMTQCLTTRSSPSTSLMHSTIKSSSVVETASYQSDASWPASINEFAQAYMTRVVRYMNHGSRSLFGKSELFPFPLHWTVGLFNGGGPSGSPIILWQLSMPSPYIQWNATEWQDAFDVLKSQYLYSGMVDSHFGKLANSQGNAVDQAFQLVAPNYATLRLVSGNTVPSNTFGITTPIPTTILMWQSRSSGSFVPIWSEWIAPVSQYPQLITQSEANATALNNDFKTSGQQIWSMLHTAVSSPSPNPTVSAPSPSTSVTSPSSTPSSSVTPSPRPPLLDNIFGKETPQGIQVQWSSYPQANLPRCAVAIRPTDSLTAEYSQTIRNGGVLTPPVGTGGLLVVNCGQGIQGTSAFSYHYGVRATGLTGLTDGLPGHPKAIIYVEYNHSGLGYGQTPDQNMADYQVKTASGKVWPVSTVQISGGQLVLTVHLPPNTPTGQPVQITISTTKSVATDDSGAPSVTTNVHGSLNTGTYAP